jgi:hypothetical protein
MPINHHSGTNDEIKMRPMVWFTVYTLTHLVRPFLVCGLQDIALPITSPCFQWPGLSKTSSGQIVPKWAGLPSQARAVQERQASLTPKGRLALSLGWHGRPMHGMEEGWNPARPSHRSSPSLFQLPLSASLAGSPRWPSLSRSPARSLSPAGYRPLAGQSAVISPRDF